MSIEIGKSGIIVYLPKPSLKSAIEAEDKLPEKTMEVRKTTASFDEVLNKIKLQDKAKKPNLKSSENPKNNQSATKA